MVNTKHSKKRLINDHALLKSLPQSFAEIDYQPLKDLLAAQQWGAADDLTHDLILKIAGREDQWLRKIDIYNLPGADLKIIDRLWRVYSNERFGFTQQCQIWNHKNYSSQKMGYLLAQINWAVRPDPAKPKHHSLLGLRTGISRDLHAPPGYLPTTFALGGGEIIQFNPDQKREPGIREKDALIGEDFIRFFLKRLEPILQAPDGKDFPDFLVDHPMNQRQPHEKIEPSPDAIALLDNLPDSTAGVDYQVLEQHLQNQNWRQANRLTRQLILGMANRQGAWLSSQDVKNLPIADLEIIDRLWRAYSNCRFGFTIQQAILRDSRRKNTREISKWYGKRCDSEAAIKEFGLRVGWSVSGEYRHEDNRNQDWVFDGLSIDDASAPIGHLPTTYDLGGGDIIKMEDYEPHPDDAVMGFLGVGYTMTIRERHCFLGNDVVNAIFRRFSDVKSTP